MPDGTPWERLQVGWESRRKLAAAPVWGENSRASPELFCGAVPEEKYLTLDGFQRFVVDRSKQDIRSVWRAILSCGYDLHFERYSLHISWGAGTDPLGSLLNTSTQVFLIQEALTRLVGK